MTVINLFTREPEEPPAQRGLDQQFTETEVANMHGTLDDLEDCILGDDPATAAEIVSVIKSTVRGWPDA